MAEPKKACRKCYAHADSLDEALAAGPYAVAKTGTVHKVSEEDEAKTECGQDIGDGWNVYVPVAADFGTAEKPYTESTATTSTADSDPNTTEEITRSRPGVPATGARRNRRRHVPPSGRRNP